MKKKFALLLAATALMLSACNLSSASSGSNTDGGQGSGNNNPPVNPTDVNDAAIKLLNSFTLFFDVGDVLEMEDYMTFDAGYRYTLNDYTFTSSNPSVVKISKYNASCVGQGFCTIRIEGPGINRVTELSVYVGSVAGRYIPDSRRLEDLMSIELGETNESKVGSIHLTVGSGSYHGTNLQQLDLTGTYMKVGAPFLVVNFPSKPSQFTNVGSLLKGLGLDLSQYTSVLNDVYAMLDYDPYDGVILRTLFLDDTLDFIAE